MMFETLAYIDRLKQAGVDDAITRAHPKALRTALGETVATKGDLKDMRAEIKAEINNVRAEMKLMEQRLINAGQRGLIALAAFVTAVAGLAFPAKAFG